MKPIIIVSTRFLRFVSFFARFNVIGICIFPFIIVNNDKHEKLIKHESVHFYQTKELWVVGFLALYVYYYLRARIKGLSHFSAYRESPFEIEARMFEYSSDKLEERKPYSWKKYRW